MGEYDDLCGQMGLDPSSEEDYERLQDAMVSGRSIRTFPDEDLDSATERLRFSTFREASDWSKRNGGRPFTRSSDGKFFIPVDGSDAAQHDGPIRLKQYSFKDQAVHFVEVSRAEVQAYLQGAAAPGTDWLPGTWIPFPIPPEMQETHERDSLLEQEVFWPRLRKLAPDIYRDQMRMHPFYTTYSFSATRHYQTRTIQQLRQLLELLEGKLIRTRRGYATHAAARGESRTFEEIPTGQLGSVEGRRHEAKHGKTPKDLWYWHSLVQALRTEISRRLSK